MMHYKNKFISVLLAIMVAVAWTVPSFADDQLTAAGAESSTEAVTEETAPAEKAEPEEEPVKEEQPSEEEKQSEDVVQQEESLSTESTSEEAGTNTESVEQSTSEVKTNAGSSESVKAAGSGHSVYYEVNNSTSLADGEYQASGFSYSGGTKKAKFFCDKVIISGGKAKAVIRTSSTKYEHFFTGTVEQENNGDDANTDLYNTATGAIGKGVYKTNIADNGAFATIPVSIGTEMYLSGRTTAMEDAHWITYRITVSVEDSDRIGDAGIQDGTYKPDKFEFDGGTGKAKFDCSKVIVINGNATAVFTTNSDKMTHVYMGTAPSENETPELYDPATKKKGKDVYTIGNKQVSVPVVLNEVKPFSGRTTAMTAPHWVNYTYKITLTPDSEKISDSTDIPTNPEEGTEPVDPTPVDPTPVDPTPVDPKDKQKLSVGTWKVKATTDRKMFYLNPKTTDPAWVILKVNKNKSMTATITLSGDGYDYVYMGTPKQARNAGKSKWIKAKVVNGYYTFTIPVSSLDKKLTITPHSKKYELDADPTTDPWRPNKWILFYSKGAQKVKDGTTINPGKKKASDSEKTSGTQKEFKNDNKADKESKWKDDRNKSTSAVDNSTSLKDGVYTPDQFRWSGGSGRLAYIRCNKITVKGGKAFATIEFGSSKYDSLKANGRIYSKQGGGNSKFVIPVKLNANNTIIGRTTAMSQPHWVQYKIFIYKAGATGGKDDKDGTDGKLVSTNKLSDKAPELIGLTFEEKTEIKNAELFKIFKYEQGITLIEIDQSKDTALYKKPKKESEEAKSDAANGEEKIEYDEEGKPIAKSENEFTNELYQNNIVNYLVVPEGVELPAGLEKDCIIINKPVDSTFAFAEEAGDKISKLGKKDVLQKMDDLGEYDKPDFKKIVLEEGDLAVFPSTALPEKVTKKSTDEQVEASKEKTETLHRLQMRYSSLSIPMIIDRSKDETTNYGDMEWIKVYGAIYGEEKASDELFEKYIKENKKEKIDNEQ
ncbi:MAG: hypothetical protein IJJ01_04915 [Firmicutes bacterium]|nr:hypothetical protein [Bacillota bacterium]